MSKNEANEEPDDTDTEEKEKEPEVPTPPALPESLEFDLDFKEIPVKVKSKEGIVTEYTLRELDGADRDKFTSLMARRSKIGRDGEVAGKIDPSGLEQKLVGMCMHDKEGKLVPEPVITSFPGRVQATLFETCVLLNGLDKGAQERAKKKQSAKS